MTAPQTSELSKAYDDTPYSSFPFSQTNPALLRAIGVLFGLNPPPIETARILEIGCASGNNILSMAARYPKSQCVGVDYSVKQIEEGQITLKSSGVKNLKLECKSIMDIDKSYGEFDYIISHGVFSWIPPEIQQKLLEVSSNNLSANGIAYISYNTFPGWSAVYSIREMMLYHTAKYTDPKQRVQQARALLKFISESLKNNKTFYAQVINSEMELLDKQSDYYLLHEHLEENNRPYYFHEFMKMAGDAGLQYLGDTSLASMFSGNLPKETAQVLSTAEDIVRMEQYMDFINNRRFRSSLLCHKDRILRRKLQPEMLADTYLSTSFRKPEGLDNYQYGSNETVTFTTPANLSLSSNDPLVIATIATLIEEKNRPLYFPELFKRAKKMLTDRKITINGADEQISQALLTNILRSVFAGSIIFYTEEPAYTNKVSEKPNLFPLARAQAPLQKWVANMRQEHITISELDKHLMPLVNGTRDAKAIATDLVPYFTSGKLNLNKDNVKITDPKKLEELLLPQVNSMLPRYAELALLQK